MLHIYDGNNEYRRRLEADASGLTIRSIVEELEQNTRTEGPSIVVWDGMNPNARRRAIFPNYKVKPTQPGENIFEGIKFCKELMKFTSAIQVECPGWEADDVIAALVTKYRKRHEILIHSNDGDYLQLGVRTTRENGYDGVEADQITLYKATVGDPADKIPGIKGFGEKTWAAVDKRQLAAAMHDLVEGLGKGPSFYEVENMPKSCANWAHSNADELRAMWRVVNFIPVPNEEIEKGTTVGKPCPPAIEAALKQFLL